MTRSEGCLAVGLSTQFFASKLRKAYHHKAKEAHPDRCSDKIEAHLRRIEVNQAYNLLRGSLGEVVPDASTTMPLEGDYELYRRGVRIFEKVHPSEWGKVTQAGLFDPSALERTAETSVALRLATQRISEVYQIFTELLDKFPDSLWAADSRDKLHSLDKMLVRYKKMLDQCR